MNPEISERISLGLVIVGDKEISVRYSTQKMKALRLLCDEKQYEFVSRVIRSMHFGSVDEINYMVRYSNNLIALSAVQQIDLDNNEQNRNWLYRNYVYAGSQT
ncbi:MAG: hypothetical protein IJT30_02095 [Muribaculaceae bacterium]|nr:hypothetical protein [Muribaculaceae bacterium]